MIDTAIALVFTTALVVPATWFAVTAVENARERAFVQATTDATYCLGCALAAAWPLSTVLP